MTSSLNLDSIKAIFLDLDNTLIMTRVADNQACKMIIEVLIDKYSLDSSIAQTAAANFLSQFRQCPHNTSFPINEWRTSLWEGVLPDTCSHLAGDIHKTWIQFRYECMKPSKCVINLLKRLRDHYTLVMITNGTSEHQWEKINMLKMRKYFDCVIVSGDWPWKKPDPNIFYEACQAVSVKPCQCVMVGDKVETDILGGIQANLGGTILLTKSGKKMISPRPHITIEDIHELSLLLPPTSALQNKSSSHLMDVDESSCSSNASR